jgi:hypothetical protein
MPFQKSLFLEGLDHFRIPGMHHSKKLHSYGNYFVSQKGMSLMTVIYEAYQKFKNEYLHFGNNINTTELFSNNAIMEEGGQSMEEVVFGRGRYEEIRHRIGNKAAGEVCTREGGMISKEETERVFGLRINWAEYFRLRVEIE